MRFEDFSYIKEFAISLGYEIVAPTRWKPYMFTVKFKTGHKYATVLDCSYNNGEAISIIENVNPYYFETDENRFFEQREIKLSSKIEDVNIKEIENRLISYMKKYKKYIANKKLEEIKYDF